MDWRLKNLAPEPQGLWRVCTVEDTSLLFTGTCTNQTFTMLCRESELMAAHSAFFSAISFLFWWNRLFPIVRHNLFLPQTVWTRTFQAILRKQAEKGVSKPSVCKIELSSTS